MKGEILSIDTVKRIADLEKRINKAIEYIEENCGADNRINLKKILKGSDNND